MYRDKKKKKKKVRKSGLFKFYLNDYVRITVDWIKCYVDLN